MLFAGGVRASGVTVDFLRTYLQLYIWKFVKVGRVVDGSHLDRNGGWPFPDVLPVDAAEEGRQLQLLDASLRTLDKHLHLPK